MITLTTDKKCTGCTACEQICPKNAISMKCDKEGFLFPAIDDNKCIECKKCINVCSAENLPAKTEPVQIFAARAKNEDVVAHSSSGGVFTLLANLIISGSGVVYGAGFDENFAVVHKRAETCEDAAQLAGSKYVQSFLVDTFKNVQKDLHSGKQVLFVGTPCQCAGLKSFLGNAEYENLLMADFVCHGVPSAVLYKKYIEEISCGKKVVRVNFRSKTKGEKGYRMGIDFADGNQYRSEVVRDPYLLAYAQNISLRKSCYTCSFKDFHLASDITLGDFWGIEDTDSFLNDKQGVSLVMINSQKGAAAFEAVRGDIDTDSRLLEEATAKNPSILCGVKKNPLREKYLKDSDRLDINKLADKYCGNSYTAKLRRLIAKCRKDR